ncbi:MAG: Spy/CpxP family protein refolding chaperone [Betaproteobacteria bacterium]|nr:Spy/CpxP family protein refolding chaperone [Betaproteobacteria bacterium]
MNMIKLFTLASFVVLLSQSNVYAESTTEKKETAVNYEQQFIVSQLNDLHDKIQLNTDQESAWNKWSTGVKNDFSEMHEMMEDSMSSNYYRHDGMLTTPERLDAYQSLLNHRLELLKEHINKVKQATQRTLSFYNVLDSKQKVIFDLFWSNWQRNYATHYSMKGHGYGHGNQPAMPPRMPMSGQ